MPLFNNFEQLQREVEKQSLKALQDDVSRVIYDTLQKFVLEDIYNNYYEYNDIIKQNIKIFKSFI